MVNNIMVIPNVLALLAFSVPVISACIIKSRGKVTVDRNK